MGKAYQCDGCGRLAPSAPEKMGGWIGVQTFQLPDGGKDGCDELDFCSAFDAGAYFFRDSRMGPAELHRLLRLIAQMHSPGPVSRTVYEEVQEELVHLQHWVNNWVTEGMVEGSQRSADR